MRNFKTIISVLFLVLIPLACGAIVNTGPVSTVKDIPDTLKLHSKYARTDVTEYVYQGCDYIHVNSTTSSGWGAHKGNCSNPIHLYHDILVPDSLLSLDSNACENSNLLKNSLNEDYKACYIITGVDIDYQRDIFDHSHILEVYTIYYLYRDKELVFKGTLTKAMLFGFDLNEVILWSNL